MIVWIAVIRGVAAFLLVLLLELLVFLLALWIFRRNRRREKTMDEDDLIRECQRRRIR